MPMHGAMGGGNSGDLQATPIVVNFTTILAADDIVIVPVPFAADLCAITAPIGGHLQALTAGTLAIDVKNDAGTIFGTCTWTAAGAPTVTARNVSTIAAGDSFHFNVTNAGTAPVDCTIVIWLRIRG